MNSQPRMDTDEHGWGGMSIPNLRWSADGLVCESLRSAKDTAGAGSSVCFRVHPCLSMVLLLALLALTGCQSLPPEQAIDLTEPGWSVRQGQALWWRDGAPELAGELLVASHPDGRALVQFLKTPVVLVTARTSSNRWRIEAAPDYFHEGYGAPPSASIWLHLAKFIHGAPPPGRWGHERRADGSWWLHNRTTGERLEGFLAP